MGVQRVFNIQPPRSMADMSQFTAQIQNALAMLANRTNQMVQSGQTADMPPAQENKQFYYDAQADQLYFLSDVAKPIASGTTAGETNTGSNVGTGGVGVFDAKTGVDLGFKTITAGSSKITVTNIPATKNVQIDANFAGLGDASTDTATSVDGEVALFKSTTGKLLKRSTLTASFVQSTAGILSAATTTGFETAALFAYLTSNQTSNSASLVNIPGLTVALVANSVYEFEAALEIITAGTDADFGINFSAAGATLSSLIFFMSDNVTAVNKGGYLATLNSKYNVVGASAYGGVLIKGLLTTGANAGNLTVQYDIGTGAPSVSCLSGSYLKAYKRA